MKIRYLTGVAGIALFMGLLAVSCEEAPSQPQYGDPDNPDPNPTGLDAAQLVSVTPSTAYLRDILAITGSGFDMESVEYNFVDLGGKRADVLTASETAVTIRAPFLFGDTMDVRIAVKGSEFWSNSLSVAFVGLDSLLEVISDYDVNPVGAPKGLAVDDNGNVYLAGTDDGIIYKITPDGTMSEFAAVDGLSGAMKFGPGGALYVCLQWADPTKIVKVTSDGATVEDVVEVADPIGLDWDADGNMYIVSNWWGIFKLDAAGNLSADPLVEIENPKVCRVFDDYLYVSDIWNGLILRYAISDDGLGEEEVVVDDIDSPSSFDFDADGVMYVAPAWETHLVAVYPDGHQEVLYEGELLTPMRFFYYHDKSLYVLCPNWGDVGLVMRAYLGANSAPYYGPTL